jgi:hypothetical protein
LTEYLNSSGTTTPVHGRLSNQNLFETAGRQSAYLTLIQTSNRLERLLRSCYYGRSPLPTCEAIRVVCTPGLCRPPLLSTVGRPAATRFLECPWAPSGSGRGSPHSGAGAQTPTVSTLGRERPSPQSRRRRHGRACRPARSSCKGKASAPRCLDASSGGYCSGRQELETHPADVRGARLWFLCREGVLIVWRAGMKVTGFWRAAAERLCDVLWWEI